MSFNTDNDVPYWVLVGIVSQGPEKCGKDSVPGVHTKVSSFMRWLAETIRL